MSIERQNKLNRRYHTITWQQHIQARLMLWAEPIRAWAGLWAQSTEPIRAWAGLWAQSAVTSFISFWIDPEFERSLTGIEQKRRACALTERNRNILENCWNRPAKGGSE